MECKHCAKILEPDATVCPNCGQSVIPEPQPKSRIIAGLLGIFLGTFGLHNFYLGRTGKACAQLLITVLTLGTLAFISTIWGLVEGILLLAGKLPTQHVSE